MGGQYTHGLTTIILKEIRFYDTISKDWYEVDMTYSRREHFLMLYMYIED